MKLPFSIKYVYDPMWKTKSRWSFDSVAEAVAKLLELLQTPTVFFFGCFLSVFSFSQRTKKQNCRKKFCNLAVNNNDVFFYFRRDSCYVYSSGPCSPMEAPRTRGGTCGIQAAENIGNTSFTLNVPTTTARDTRSVLR